MKQTAPVPMTRKQMMRRLGGFTLALGGAVAVAGWLLDSSLALELGALGLLLGGIWLACSLFTRNDPMQAPERRYLREFLPAMLAYVLIMVFLFPLGQKLDATWLKVLVALSPVLPTLLAARAMVRHMLAGDELERRIQLEAAAITAVVIGLLSLSTGLLQAAEVVTIEAALIWVFPAMAAVWGMALWWAKRRYNSQ